MTIVRYNPWREMNSLQRQLDKIFDDVIVPNTNSSNLNSFPAAELIETESALELRLEIPGMKASDLDIQVTANTVTVAGERKAATEASENKFARSEFRYGKFQRVIPLPIKVQNTNVKANYNDGILYLVLPKREEELNKVVKVNLDNSVE